MQVSLEIGYTPSETSYCSTTHCHASETIHTKTAASSPVPPTKHVSGAVIVWTAHRRKLLAVMRRMACMASHDTAAALCRF